MDAVLVYGPGVYPDGGIPEELVVRHFNNVFCWLDNHGMLSEEGKKLYLYAELPLDCVFPFCYTPFFALSLQSLRKKKGLFFALPFLLAAFDYFENGCTAYLLTHPSFSQTAAGIARVATTGKSILMYFIIGTLLFNLLKKFLKKRKKF